MIIAACSESRRKEPESPRPQKHQSQNKKKNPLSLKAENLLLLKGALSGGSS